MYTSNPKNVISHRHSKQRQEVIKRLLSVKLQQSF